MNVRNLAALQRACAKLNLPCTIGPGQRVTFYDRTEHQGDCKVELPGWAYPVLFNTQTGEVKSDNYNGAWGDIDRLHQLTQEYSLQVAEIEAQELVLQGFTIERQTLSNGDVQLVIAKE